MNEFIEARIGELFRLKHGYAFKSAYFVNESDLIVVTPGNFFDEGGFKHKGQKEKFYDGPVPDGYMLNRGDLIVAMTEQAEGLLGSPAVIPEDSRYLHNQRLGKVVDLDDTRLDKSFLYCLFNFPSVRAQIRASANGAKVRHTSPARIYDVEVRLPPLSTQRRIASILSAYDDLIENNTRRIAILEEMARRLYEEWFVRFRFPGHEDVEFDGGLPKGWVVLALKEVARLRSGYAFKSGTFTSNGYKRLVTIKNVQDGVFDPNNVSRLDDVPSNVPKHCFLDTDDILLSLTGNVGRVCVVYGGEFLLNQRVAKIETASYAFRSFIYFTFRDHSFRKHLENIASGVAQQNLSPVKTEELELNVPPLDLAERFEVFAGPVMQFCRALNEQNANLRTQRDLLLPKLVSGEIDVSEAEEDLGGAAA